ncbi:hypothetical protein N7468_003220 [Penicillium chermesinum]|uniref:S-adenosyl-L-methionine-dependent methyltransferase n=1 Tax=Penicillium chermesinum TaxID=63820 RepID=A0A9W9P6S1_9EURO|nr:uncharacterized protein N7468_003220 [Penicillium chermesinum]KAJ5238601.1 hypothetical protein N7468_003220 [Penicillium chermesinum]KAJ6164253.1 hypothetical protein N7470_002925 [Penicillium chermesinum]
MLSFLRWLFKYSRPEMYGLDHAVLNIQLPPQTMWMNMGYWESTSDFPEACRSLLEQVITSGLLSVTERSGPVRVVDVGCGCGDQALYLTDLRRNPPGDEASASGFEAVPSNQTAQPRTQEPRLLDTYVGITLEPGQAALAQRRLQDKHGDLLNSLNGPSARVFCGDAADPTQWSAELQNFIAPLVDTAQSGNAETWLLALDTLYHFRPSRLPILKYAHDTLHASVMAFDLILADNVSWRERVLLQLFCWLTGAPFGNLISQEKYLRMLMAAGYDPSRIEMRDLTRHVFSGLSAYLDRRVQEAAPFGLKMGKFSAARMVFDWWARSGILRGVVVVARRS